MLESFLFALIFNCLMFIPAFIFKTDKLTDISYSLTFIGIVSYLFFVCSNQTNIVQIILYIMICLWALRLGGYLLYRIHKIGRDKRFDTMRQNFLKFLGFWFFQGITVFLILIPSIFVLEGRSFIFNGWSIFGLSIFLFGLSYESIADAQKFKFIMLSENKNSFIHTGLWKYSRYPNYFGEICVWVGIYIYCACYLNFMTICLSLISPVFIFILLRYISGIPLQEKSAESRFAGNADYKKYKTNTPMLFPGSRHQAAG